MPVGRATTGGFARRRADVDERLYAVMRERDGVREWAIKGGAGQFSAALKRAYSTGVESAAQAFTDVFGGAVVTFVPESERAMWRERYTIEAVRKNKALSEVAVLRRALEMVCGAGSGPSCQPTVYDEALAAARKELEADDA